MKHAISNVHRMWNKWSMGHITHLSNNMYRNSYQRRSFYLIQSNTKSHGLTQHPPHIFNRMLCFRKISMMVNNYHFFGYIFFKLDILAVIHQVKYTNILTPPPPKVHNCVWGKFNTG